MTPTAPHLLGAPVLREDLVVARQNGLVQLPLLLGEVHAHNEFLLGRHLLQHVLLQPCHGVGAEQGMGWEGRGG